MRNFFCWYWYVQSSRCHCAILKIVRYALGLQLYLAMDNFDAVEEEDPFPPLIDNGAQSTEAESEFGDCTYHHAFESERSNTVDDILINAT